MWKYKIQNPFNGLFFRIKNYFLKDINAFSLPKGFLIVPLIASFITSWKVFVEKLGPVFSLKYLSENLVLNWVKAAVSSWTSLGTEKKNE